MWYPKLEGNSEKREYIVYIELIHVLYSRNQHNIAKPPDFDKNKYILFFYFYFFKFYFILLYNTVLVLPYINMNPPRVYILKV